MQEFAYGHFSLDKKLILIGDFIQDSHRQN